VIAVAELREEAAEVRDLASTFKDTSSAATDLLKYASALEVDSARWESPPLAELGAMLVS
jgi:hypothetical protein